MGTCLNYGNAVYKRELQNKKTLDFVKKQFNSFTLENEMKPDAILGGKATTISKEEAIENLVGFFFDYYYEVSNILYELRQEAEIEEKMMLEAKKYEDM